MGAEVPARGSPQGPAFLTHSSRLWTFSPPGQEEEAWEALPLFHREEPKAREIESCSFGEERHSHTLASLFMILLPLRIFLFNLRSGDWAVGDRFVCF